MADNFHALFEIPIEALALSPHTLNTLKWHGRVSIGDCLAFYVDDARGWFPSSWKMHTLMYGEVFESIVAGDHWHALECADMWQRFERAERFGRPGLTWWQGKEQDLYEVPIDVLTLTIQFSTRLKRADITSIGDCVDVYWHLRLGSMFGLMMFSEAEYEELEACLMDLDCWNFIVEQFDD